jgi:hypothetical protein
MNPVEQAIFKVKEAIFQILDLTLGKFLRRIQRMLSKTDVTVTDAVRAHALHESAQYAISNMSTAIMFNDRKNLWDFCIGSIKRNSMPMAGSIIALEFGVFKGSSINHFADSFKEYRLLGFDSFEGLSEDWSGEMLKGHFNLNGNLPRVRRNVTLIKGWIDETTTKYFSDHMASLKDVALIHLDLDTYSPTKIALESASDLIKPGQILIFDEYFGYSKFEEQEFKAFKEFVKTYEINYRYLGFTDMQVAVQIL